MSSLCAPDSKAIRKVLPALVRVDLLYTKDRCMVVDDDNLPIVNPPMCVCRWPESACGPIRRTFGGPFFPEFEDLVPTT